MRIAFIGLGNMGAPMARNLLKGGYDVTVFDLSERAMALLCEAGAKSAESPRQAASGADVIMSMLPAGAHVRSVYLGADGVLAGVTPGVPLIDSSTIGPEAIREIATAAAAKGNPMADAPVSGGTVGAEAGTLTFMVGADAQLFEAIKPVLGAMGRNVVHCGDVGTGQTAKLCNNLVLGISMVGVAEAMSLGGKLGIDPSRLASIINTSTGRCWASDTCNPYPGVVETAPASRGYSGGFGALLMLKDLGLAMEAGRGVHQALFMGSQAQQMYEMMAQRGDGALDFSAVIRQYEEKE